VTDRPECTFCHDGLSLRGTDYYRRVQGWEKPRRQGGTNAIVLRDPLPVYACHRCIWRQQHGIDEAQGSML
jgi:hypothetical protein